MNSIKAADQVRLAVSAMDKLGKSTVKPCVRFDKNGKTHEKTKPESCDGSLGWDRTSDISINSRTLYR